VLFFDPTLAAGSFECWSIAGNAKDAARVSERERELASGVTVLKDKHWRDASGTSDEALGMGGITPPDEYTGV
jgi:hypothetical protein